MGAFFSKSKSVRFTPDKDISTLRGKVILVTGGNSGLGKETVLQLAKHNPKAIILCCRTLPKGQEALKDIKNVASDVNVEVLQLDLASFKSIEKASREFTLKHDRLDVLINNAGLMAVPPTKTAEGYEVQFGVNHMGHFLLTTLLLPTLLKTVDQLNADVRIINLASTAHAMAPAPGINFADTSLPDKSVWARYGQSKLANILFAKALAKRYDKILSVAVHPGPVDTNLANTWLGKYVWLKHFLGRLFLKTAQEGAKNQLWAATVERANIESGEYYTPVGVKDEGNGYTKDEKMADELWEWSLKQCKEHGY